MEKYTAFREEILSYARQVVKTPAPGYPCLLIETTYNLTAAHCHAIADRIIKVCEYYQYVQNPNSRQTVRSNASENITRLLDFPKSWQVSRAEIISFPTNNAQTAYSINTIYNLIVNLRSKQFSPKEITYVLSILLQQAFSPEQLDLAHTPPTQDKIKDDIKLLPVSADQGPPQQASVSSVNGESAGALSATAAAVHEELKQVTSARATHTTPDTMAPPTAATLPYLACLPQFDGRDETKDFAPYKAVLEATLRALSVPETIWGEMLLLSVKEPALRVVLAERERNANCKYQDVIAALEKAYGNKSTPETYLDKLEARVKSPGESVQNFCRDVEALCKKVDKNMPENLVIARIKRGLPIEIQRVIIRDNFKTVQELASAVEQIESGQTRLAQLEAGQLLKTSVDRNVAALTDSARLDELSAKVDTLLRKLEDPNVAAVQTSNSSSNNSSSNNNSSARGGGNGGRRGRGGGRGRNGNGGNGNGGNPHANASGNPQVNNVNPPSPCSYCNGPHQAQECPALNFFSAGGTQ
ncbi:hypothetical protein ONE63_005159 [Megalurothrips usitatus]|uniref:Paraneoplastic antigen Ma-like C-terminal domain-containing protein n=1 Tax=Megalurothrips usitatus TaxID=439358 RepID=A0AAV7XUI4_9NEOP|nr:hypothetical protein ONE63_005159 [Megalurothrips usitatus]